MPQKLSKLQKTVSVSRIAATIQTTEMPNHAFSKTVNGLEQIFIRRIPFWKRAMDIVGSLLGLVLLSPVFLLITILIKIVSPGPVIYKQKRVGQQGKLFNMLKFRTMRVDSDTNVHLQHVKKFLNGNSYNSPEKPMEKLDNDPQIIPLNMRINAHFC